VAEVWHRFYLDAGLLFWEEGVAPDPDDEVLEGETLEDVGRGLGIVGVPILKIEMSAGRFVVGFGGGGRIVLECGEEDDSGHIVELMETGKDATS
jgi:hypothetical protein